MRGFQNIDRAFFPSSNSFGFPELEPVTELVSSSIDWFSFPERRFNRCYAESGVHFYCDDYLFESVWNQPLKYVETLRYFKCVVMPDFSLYYDFPAALQIYNKYRNHWLARFMSFYGVSVIPNVNISTPDCWEWSFLGYPRHSVVAWSDIGSVQKLEDRKVLQAGYDEMLKRLEPVQVVYFTRNADTAPAGVLPVVVPFGRRLSCGKG